MPINIAGNSDTSKYVYNTALTITVYGLARGNQVAVRRALAQVYCQKEICDVKQIPWDCNEVYLGAKPERRPSNNRRPIYFILLRA